jgi:hypothetical protein
MMAVGYRDATRRTAARISLVMNARSGWFTISEMVPS